MGAWKRKLKWRNFTAAVRKIKKKKMQEEDGAFEVWLRSTYKAVQRGFSEGLIINGNISGSAN